MTEVTRVTEEYPSENKGVLEILRNPWNDEKAMLLVEGSDARGVKVASEMPDTFKFDEIQNTEILSTTFSFVGNNIQRINLESLQPGIFREQVIININNYDVNDTTGLVVIDGVTQSISFNEPILPMLFLKKTLPYGSDVSSITWNEAESQCTIVDNDVPIAGIGSSEVTVEGSFTYSIIDLSTDKQQYALQDNVTLNITLSNAGEAKVGDLNVILREFNRDAYPVDIGSMYIRGKRNVSEISVITPKDVPLSRITGGGVIESELIVTDARNDEVLASEIITLQIEKTNQGGDRK